LPKRKHVCCFRFLPYWYGRSRKKYQVKEIYLFSSYARGEADAQSDLDFLIFGGDGFRLTEILLQSYAASHHLIVFFLHQGSRL